MVNLKLFDFQEKASLKLVEITTSLESKQTILMKAPTGAGKTIILIDYIDKYINNINKNVCFVWLCPGKGDLEEQSRDKMLKLSPEKKTQNLNDALLQGFNPGTTTFINWELVTKKGNTAIRETEKKNLFERITEAQLKGIEFVVIIDEEHQNNTSKANDIINSFVAKNIIRVSATVKENSRFEYFEIPESEVIASGLITKAIYVNEGLENNEVIESDVDILLDLASKKQKEIEKRYEKLDKNIVPLVLIQFPNARPDTIKEVEEKLKKLGYTYENGTVAKWMSNNKQGLEDAISENDNSTRYLLMKQAISTGWDCPRAKILVKLREGMSEQFEIQTVGRIRRMPEAKHYDEDILDFSYVYTFDEKYKEGLLASIDKAYEMRRLFLKDEAKDFTLKKQNRNLEFVGVDEREVLEKIYSHYAKKYNIIAKAIERKNNMVKLEASGYSFEADMIRNIIQGKYVTTKSLAEEKSNYIVTRQTVSTDTHGFQLLQTVDELKKILMLPNRSVKVLLERLFRKNMALKYKILALEANNFYAFVINNKDKLKEEFREIVSGDNIQNEIILETKTTNFNIPRQDFFKYDTNVKDEIPYDKNAYENYTSGYATSLVKSTSEMLFESYVETREDISWVYKNGDTGQNYFSIVYLDQFANQWLFYPDYIIKKNDGTTWIIETKGGEFKGQSKNIDRQVGNKFEALKHYAKIHNICFGFVRDRDGKLYINNTKYEDDMSAEEWKPIDEMF